MREDKIGIKYIEGSNGVAPIKDKMRKKLD